MKEICMELNSAKQGLEWAALQWALVYHIQIRVFAD